MSKDEIAIAGKKGICSVMINVKCEKCGEEAELPYLHLEDDVDESNNRGIPGSLETIWAADWHFIYKDVVFSHVGESLVKVQQRLELKEPGLVALKLKRKKQDATPFLLCPTCTAEYNKLRVSGYMGVLRQIDLFLTPNYDRGEAVEKTD